MSSLTGTKIKDTYVGLLKTTDNGILGGTYKEITDGLGNASGVYMGTGGNLGVGLVPSEKFEVFGNIKSNASNGKGFILGGGGSIFRQNSDMTFVTSATERMRINSNGVLQIGSGAAYSAGINGKIQLTTGSVNGSGIAVAHGLNAADQYWTIGGQYSEGNANNRAEIRYAIDGSDTKTRISFHTANGAGTINERMRITSGGYLKASNTGSYLSTSALVHEVNQSADSQNIAILRSTATTPYGISLRFTASPNNTTNDFIEALDGTATRFKVYSNGNVVNSNNSYGAISDAKLKENVVDASPKLDDLMQVQIRNFNYIGSDEKQLGVVAQELETIFPSMISESPDFEEREVELRDENGEIVYETEQVLVSEEVAEVTEEVLHEAIAEELDEEGNVIVEAQEAWTETIIVTPFQEAVYETVTTDRPVMTTERVDLGTTTKAVKYSVFVPMLIKAIQELKAEVDALKGA